MKTQARYVQMAYLEVFYYLSTSKIWPDKKSGLWM